MLPVEQFAKELADLGIAQVDPEDSAGYIALHELGAALLRFSALLPAAERPENSITLLEHIASTNVFDPLRADRALPPTVCFYASVHPGYYEGDSRVGSAPWRLCYTDAGGVGPSPIRERMLDEAIRLAEAMHDKNPFGEVPFDGGKTVFLQEGHCFQAVTALFGSLAMPRFILAKGGIRYYAAGEVDVVGKEAALRAWAESSVLAGVLAQRYIGGPDMRMGETEMRWVAEAASRMGGLQRQRQHPAVTGLSAQDGGFPHQAWELTGRTVAASLKEALCHTAMSHYGLGRDRDLRLIIQGMGDVGGSVLRLLTEESPGFKFCIAGVADEFGAVYREQGLDPVELLRLREERQPMARYGGAIDRQWIAQASDADRARPGFAGEDGREILFEASDVFIPAAIPNVIDAAGAGRLQVKLVAEGANNAVAPRVDEDLHACGILYLPGQAMNWGGVKASTLEVDFKELTKRTLPFTGVERLLRPALESLGVSVDVEWALELLRSGLPGPPLGPEDTRTFATFILEDLARSNTRWLMNELQASGFRRSPISIVRDVAANIRLLKVQLLSLVESGLGDEFFQPKTSLVRMQKLLDDRLSDLLSEQTRTDITATQVVEQRQMLQQLQSDLPKGLSTVLASLAAALDLARQKVMDPEGYSQSALLEDLDALRDPKAADDRLMDSLYRLQRVHPGTGRAQFIDALTRLLDGPSRPPEVRRNAAMAMAKLGCPSPPQQKLLTLGVADPHPSVRAACQWALHQMGL